MGRLRHGYLRFGNQCMKDVRGKKTICIMTAMEEGVLRYAKSGKILNVFKRWAIEKWIR